MANKKRHITYNELTSEWPPIEHDPAVVLEWGYDWRFDPNESDWKNSWVIYGSSSAYGHHVDSKFDLAHQLSELLNEPVINCAYPGAGIQHHVLMQSLVRHHHGKPKGEIVCWSSPYKWLSFEETDREKTPWLSKANLDIYKTERHPYKAIFPQLPQQAYLGKLAAKAINPNLIEFTDSRAALEYWPDLWFWDIDKCPDRGDDGEHAGPLGISIAARWCYEQIQSK